MMAPPASLLPFAGAVGFVVSLVGLLISPEVIAPVGVGVMLVTFLFLVRGNAKPARAAVASPAPAHRPSTGAEQLSRGRLLGLGTLGLGGLVGLIVTLPVAGFAILPSFLGQRRVSVDLGPSEAFPEGEFVVTTFLTDPQAGEISRRTAYVRNNGLLGDLPSFTILSSRCTHVGCPTQPNGVLLFAQRRSERTTAGEVSLIPTRPSGFGCPCHGSQFDNEGNRTAGPAPRPLDRYEFSIVNGHLVLGRLYSVGRVEGTGAQALIEAFAAKGAGQPLSGTESWLYPIAPTS
jgi:Rieske Fe-S protein